MITARFINEGATLVLEDDKDRISIEVTEKNRGLCDTIASAVAAHVDYEPDQGPILQGPTFHPYPHDDEAEPVSDDGGLLKP